MNKFKKPKFSIDKTIENSKFNYCKNLKWFLIAPLLIVFVGLILFCTIGFNLGIDFTGGSVFKVYANSAGKAPDAEKAYDLTKNSDYNAMKSKIQAVLSEEGLKINVFRSSTIDFTDNANVTVTGEPAVEVQYQNKNDMDGTQIKELNERIQERIQTEFGYTGDWNIAISTPSVTTASASSELLMKAFIAMLVAVVLILIYVAFRFELTSGLAAVVALFHDLIVMVSFVLLFRIPINSSFIAALVTVLGYSINNTIIIFDRIRENRKNGRFEKASNEVLANASVKQTMTRSVFTTITTIVTIALVCIIGVSDIREFALPILVGILAGFYSSVFVTPGLWAIAYRPKKKKKIKPVSTSIEP